MPPGKLGRVGVTLNTHIFLACCNNYFHGLLNRTSIKHFLAHLFNPLTHFRLTNPQDYKLEESDFSFGMLRLYAIDIH